MNATSDVAAERQFAQICRRAIGDDVAGFAPVANLHQRALVDAGVLVRALELQQVVDVNAGSLPPHRSFGADHDARGVDLIDDAGPRAR